MENNRNKYHYGITLLKILLSFVVITCHGWDSSLNSRVFMPIDILKPTAVPLFFIISFYYMYNGLTSGNLEFLGKRLKRLLIPYLGWPIIALIINNILVIAGMDNINASPLQLITQYLFGLSGLIYYYWFMLVLIIGSCIYYFVFHVFSKKISCIIIVGLGLFSLIWAYTGANSYMTSALAVGHYLQNDLLMFPFLSSGCIWAINRDKIEHINKRFIFSATCFILALMVFVLQAKGILPVVEKDVYGGIYLVLFSNLLFGAVIVWPLDKLPDFCKKVIKWMGQYTLGIYSIHGIILAGITAVYSHLGLANMRIGSCVICFGISLFICWLIGCIPNKYVKALVK